MVRAMSSGGRHSRIACGTYAAMRGAGLRAETSGETALPAGGGEMGRLVRQYDWAATPLGTPDAWPQVLHTLVDLMLASSQPMFIVWGPDRTTLYNDAYSEILAGKHPVLGLPFERIWPEIWESDLEPIVSRAYAGEALHMDDIPLRMMRRGYPEETHFSFSYTPVRGSRGEVLGFFCPCLEITEEVLEKRRSRLRAELTERLRTLSTPSELARDAAAMLGRDLGADQAAYAEIDESCEFAVVAREWNKGSMASNAGRHRLCDFGQAFIEDLKAGRSVAIADIRDDVRTHAPEVLAEFEACGIRSFLNVPLLRDGRLTAVLAVNSREPRWWNPADVALCEEVTERIWTSLDRCRAERARHESEAKFRALVNSTSHILYRMNADWSEMRMLRGRDFLPDTTTPRRDWMDVYIEPAERPKMQAAIDAAVTGRNTFDLEHRVMRADGSAGWVHSRAVPLFDEDDAIVEWFGAATDVTARKEAEEHQRVLMAELDHRVKNILAVVQSIARQSLGRSGAAGGDDAERFVGRLSALAQSHRLLADSQWEGTDFTTLLDNAVAPYLGEDGTRVQVKGPALLVNTRAAQTLTLALYELVTNAAKYGALSTGGGHVTAEWEVTQAGAESRLVFHWREHSGPPIEAPPDRMGFGSRLIKRTLTYELGGEVTLDYAREGLRAVFDLPLDRIRTSSGRRRTDSRVSGPLRPGDTSVLRGKRILLCEDEDLVAQETAEALLAAGCHLVGPWPTLDQAMDSAREAEIDAAILDINLNGDLIWPAAAALRERGIPFILATGYSGFVEPPEELAHAPRLEKPLEVQRLLSKLAGLLADRS